MRFVEVCPWLKTILDRNLEEERPMRLTSLRENAKRHGSITPLTCLLLPLIIGMVAFAVDLSWLCLTRSELQNAADSAVLAGADRLGDNYVSYSLTTQTVTNKA